MLEQSGPPGRSQLGPSVAISLIITQTYFDNSKPRTSVTAVAKAQKLRGIPPVYRISIDVGGTFTDCLVMDEAGELTQFKTLTTPEPAEGFLAVLEKAAKQHRRELRPFLGDVGLLIHGTTLATNTQINRNGARTGMATTKGFRDVIVIRRGRKNVRTSMYNLFVPPYKALVPRHLRLEVGERSTYEGEVVEELNEDDVYAAAEKLQQKGVESVAICFLHSYANPGHERRAAEIVREVLDDDVYVTTSHEVLPVWREWERFSTTAVSAYVGPAVKAYLESLVARLDENGFGGELLIMLADGLVEAPENVIPRAVYLIGSGPAAAPAAALHYGESFGEQHLLSLDMGGTSTDLAFIQEGQIATTTEGWIEEERLAIKMVDIHSAGAGGGSIAWVDSLGLLRVGPQSAGSTPGPACYGRGGEDPTTTDADLLLGYIPADFFLGGEITLDPDRAATAVRAKIAEPLGMSVPQAANAILTAVSAFTADRVAEISIRRGFDVRDITLVAGGGAGPVHAVFIADHLLVPRVIVPSTASTYSAFGMFVMDVGRNYARSLIARGTDIDLRQVATLYQEMEVEALEALAKMGVPPDKVSFQRTADMRYVGQFSEVEVDVPSGTITTDTLEKAEQNFRDRHTALYTFDVPWQGVEYLTFRMRAFMPKAPFAAPTIPVGSSDASGALKRHRKCWFGEDLAETSIYNGPALLSGNTIAGPAIIEETTTTVVIPPNYSCIVDAGRNYLLTRVET